jgi:hypothetical protein
MNNVNKEEEVKHVIDIVDTNNKPTDYWCETNPDGTLKLYSVKEFYDLLKNLHDSFNKKKKLK